MDVLLNQTEVGRVIFLLVSVTVFFFAIATLLWRSKRKRMLLQQWAQENGLELLECEERHLLRGPFFLTTFDGQAVFRLTARLPDGKILHGWARCGSWIIGLLSDAVQVRWDEPPGFPVVFPAESNSPE